MLNGRQTDVFPSLKDIPDTIVIVGTDAAGKDHVANIIASMIMEAGGKVEKCKRYLAGKVTEEASSTEKSCLELIAEWGFLKLFPFIGRLLPPVLHFLLKRDLCRFRRPVKKLVVIGHNCLRGFAFYWGHAHMKTCQVNISGSLRETFAAMRSLPGLHMIVLDVEDDVRRARLEMRASCGKIDNFDRYMAADTERSERIEHFLVWLCREQLGARLIENNDLNKQELRKLLIQGFTP